MGWLSRLFWSGTKKMDEPDRSHSCCSTSMGWSKMTGSGRIVCRRAGSGWRTRFFGRHNHRNKNGHSLCKDGEIASAPASLRSSVRRSQRRKLSNGSGQSQFNRFSSGRRSSRKFRKKPLKPLELNSPSAAEMAKNSVKPDLNTSENVAENTQEDGPNKSDIEDRFVKINKHF